jgi:sensor histidine kinase regulating citrate/malate metabolism
VVGTVTTLRDRTELLAMQSELSARESVTETLRAQTHEFNNQLHTISGLIQLGEYDELSAWIGAVTRRRAEITEAVASRVDDRAVAALLVAKVSLAAERGVGIELAADTRLPRLDPDLGADVGTVLGNLVDNAVDATVAAGGSTVSVRLRDDRGEDGDLVLVQVADSGAGVPPENAAHLFDRGYSTKPGDASGRGVGLALVQVVCERRVGAVSVHNDRGAVFTARLPHTVVDRGPTAPPNARPDARPTSRGPLR